MLWTTSMMQVKFFLYSVASLWKEDLTPLLVGSRFTSEPPWSWTNLFDEALSFGQDYLAVANLVHLCRPSSPNAGPFLLWLPVPPMPPSHSFANRGSPSPASLSLSHGSIFCLPHRRQPLAVPYLACRCRPHSCRHSPMSRRSLGISLNKTPKFPLINFVDLSSSEIKTPYNL